MPHILILDRFYFPDEQATSIYLTEITQALQSHFKIEVLCGPPLVVTNGRFVSLSASAIKIHRVPCLSLPKHFLFFRTLNDLSFLLSALIRGVFIPKPQLIVSQTSPPLIWWVSFFLSRWHCARWIHISKDMFPENLMALNGRKKPRWLIFLERINDAVLRQADQILVIGDDMRERFLNKNFPCSRIFRTSDWADLDFIQPLPRINSFRQKYGLTDKFIVLYAGNFGRLYNFEDLTAAAEKLRGVKEVIFVLVGDGAGKGELVSEVKNKRLDNVLIVPFEPRLRLPEVLATADVSVVLLRRGMAGLSVPSKIYSLFASGRPILACVDPESETARLVHESEAGFVISPGNVQEFAQRIGQLYDDPVLKERLGEKARRFAEGKDFQSKAFRDYKRVFQEVLNGH